MAIKTNTEVVIGGRVLTLCGYESEEYLQKVASYINNKLAEYRKVESFKHQSLETQHVLLELNIADELHKEKYKLQELEEEMSHKDKELYELRHETVSIKVALEECEKSLEDAFSIMSENEKTIIRMEAELKELKSRNNYRK